MRFLRHISKSKQDSDSEPEEEDLAISLSEYLASKFQVPAELHDPLLSLSLSQASPQQTSAEYAVPRIKRHLASIGVFGPGFGSLLAKWGGGSELSQVGCRALAVGGGVYMLNAGVNSITTIEESKNGEDARIELHLSNDEAIKTKFLVGSPWSLPGQGRPSCDKVARSIAVVSSSLERLFPLTAEGGPIPAGAVVVFPGSSLNLADDLPPVYLLVHSSETGECPSGQSTYILPCQ
jgi:RAB protein geranylgeranyltransferase component A